MSARILGDALGKSNCFLSATVCEHLYERVFRELSWRAAEVDDEGISAEERARGRPHVEPPRRELPISASGGFPKIAR